MTGAHKKREQGRATGLHTTQEQGRVTGAQITREQGRATACSTPGNRDLMQPIAHLQVVALIPGWPTRPDNSADALESAGNQTADLHVESRLHYHSTVACSDSRSPPHGLKPSLPLKETKTVCFCLPACLPD